MRHYIVLAPGDDVEVAFMYHGLPSIKRTYTAPPKIVAEIESGAREPFWQHSAEDLFIRKKDA